MRGALPVWLAVAVATLSGCSSGSKRGSGSTPVDGPSAGRTDGGEAGPGGSGGPGGAGAGGTGGNVSVDARAPDAPATPAVKVSVLTQRYGNARLGWNDKE